MIYNWSHPPHKQPAQQRKHRQPTVEWRPKMAKASRADRPFIDHR
jgi:hypothetical protein